MKRVTVLSIMLAMALGAGALFMGCANDNKPEDSGKLLLLMPQQQQKFFPELPQGVAQ